MIETKDFRSNKIAAQIVRKQLRSIFTNLLETEE